MKRKKKVEGRTGKINNANEGRMKSVKQGIHETGNKMVENPRDFYSDTKRISIDQPEKKKRFFRKSSIKQITSSHVFRFHDTFC